MNTGLFSLIALIASAVYQIVLATLETTLGGLDDTLRGPLVVVLTIILPVVALTTIGRRVSVWGGGPNGTNGLWLALFISVAATFFGIMIMIVYVIAVSGL